MCPRAALGLTFTGKCGSDLVISGLTLELSFGGKRAQGCVQHVVTPPGISSIHPHSGKDVEILVGHSGWEGVPNSELAGPGQERKAWEV